MQTEQKQKPHSNLVIDTPSVRAISISVRAKKVFYKSLTKEQMDAGVLLDQEVMQEMEPIVEKYGRHAVLTFKLRDGTKRRYRGNGGVILGDPTNQLTDYARKINFETLEREAFLFDRRETLNQKQKEKERETK